MIKGKKRKEKKRKERKRKGKKRKGKKRKEKKRKEKKRKGKGRKEKNIVVASLSHSTHLEHRESCSPLRLFTYALFLKFLQPGRVFSFYVIPLTHLYIPFL